MKPKLKGLARFAGMTWVRAKKELDQNAHMLVLDSKNDKSAIQVAEAYRDFGLEMGMATLATALFMKKHGASTTALKASEIYHDISKKIKADEKLALKLRDKTDKLDFELTQMEGWIHYAQPTREAEWVLKPEYDKENEIGNWAGQANVMLYLSVRKLSEGNMCELIAAQGIQRFMDRASKEKG